MQKRRDGKMSIIYRSEMIQKQKMLRSNPDSYTSRIALIENSSKEECRHKYKWDLKNKLPEEISKEEEKYKYKHPDYEGRMNAHKCREGMSQEIDREKFRLKHEWCLLPEDFEKLYHYHHHHNIIV